MKEVFGNMNNKLILSVLFLIGVLSADDEIYIDQNGNNASIDLEQLGSNNLIGGTDSVAGTLTALDLDGASMTLDINQIGSSNIFRSDAIDGESFTGFFEFTGEVGSALIVQVGSCLHRATIPKSNCERELMNLHIVPVFGQTKTAEFSQSWIYRLTH